MFFCGLICRNIRGKSAASDESSTVLTENCCASSSIKFASRNIQGNVFSRTILKIFFVNGIYTSDYRCHSAILTNCYCDWKISTVLRHCNASTQNRVTASVCLRFKLVSCGSDLSASAHFQFSCTHFNACSTGDVATSNIQHTILRMIDSERVGRLYFTVGNIYVRVVVLTIASNGGVGSSNCTAGNIQRRIVGLYIVGCASSTDNHAITIRQHLTAFDVDDRICGTHISGFVSDVRVANKYCCKRHTSSIFNRAAL